MQFPQPNSRTMPFRVASIPAALFILSTFFQRLGIWFAGFPFPLVLISSPFLLAYGLIKQRVKLSSTRLTLFVFLAGSIVTSIILANRMTATSALAYFLIYTQWVLYYPVSKDEYIKYLRIIAVITSAICLIGAMQYFSQFIVKSQYVFTWKGIIPSDYLIEQNTLNELSYNSGQYKSNGFFLTEPSSLSGLAARVLLLVVILLKDIRFVVPLIIGLLFSLSGTGLVFTLLFTAIPLIYLLIKKASQALRANRKAQIPIAVIAAVTVGALFIHYFDYFVGRLDEFSNPHASGYARYTFTLVIFNEHVMRSFGSFLFGYGPGSFDPLTGSKHCTGWIKLFVELGFLGVLSFSAFFLACVYSSTRSWYIAVAIWFHYLILDSPVLSPQFVFLAYSIFVFPMLLETDDAKHDGAQRVERDAIEPLPRAAGAT
jgi:hypothetical protein